MKKSKTVISSVNDEYRLLARLSLGRITLRSPALKSALLSVTVSIATMTSLNIHATEMVYQAVNPSFGGNPLNSSHLFSVANGINDYKPSNSDLGIEETSALDLLTSSLESRLITQLLGDVGNGNSGQLVADDYVLNIIDTDGSLSVQITDKNTGGSSVIQVSGLTPDY